MEVGHNKPEAKDPVDNWNLKVKIAFALAGGVLSFAVTEKVHKMHTLPISLKEGPVAEALAKGEITEEQLERGVRKFGPKVTALLVEEIKEWEKTRKTCTYKTSPEARLKETPDACKEKSGVETGPVKPTSSGIVSWLLARKEPRLQ